MSHSGGESGPTVADRMFTVLETCAASNRPLTLVDLVERTGFPKTTLHRVCWKLESLGMLAHTNQGFRIGMRLFALGGTNPMLRILRAAAMPFLHSLTTLTDCATNLAVQENGQALILEEVFGKQCETMSRMVGATLPLHATAVGKALLAGLDDAALDAWLESHRLRPYTRSTVVRPNLLRTQIQRVRSTGVALSTEDWAVGTSGIAAPIRFDGVVVAAVAVVGRMSDTELRQLEAPVRGAADGIARTLSTPAVAVAA